MYTIQYSVFGLRKSPKYKNEKYPVKKITQILIGIIFSLKNYPITNTNNILIFGFKKSLEYKYEY